MPDEPAKKRKIPKRKLTVKQIKFVKEFKKSGNASQSALKAGYKVRESATDVLANPLVKSRLERFYDTLEEEGATDKAAAKVIKDGFTAVKTDFAATIDEEGERKTEVVESPDHPTRLKAADLFCKVKRYVGADNTNGPIGPISGNVMIFLQDPHDPTRNTAPKEAGPLLPA